MKRPSLLLFFFTTILFSLGVTSCKKDCTDCFSYTDNYGTTYTYCETDSEFDTRAQYDAYITLIKAAGYAVNEFEQCD